MALTRCEYHDTCPASCTRQAPSLLRWDTFTCGPGGVTAKCVPVVPEVAEPEPEPEPGPERMRCEGEGKCRGMIKIGCCVPHPRADACGTACGDYRCVPVAAKPDPALQTDDALHAMIAARDALRKAKVARAAANEADRVAHANYKAADKEVDRCAAAGHRIFTAWFVRAKR